MVIAVFCLHSQKLDDEDGHPKQSGLVYFYSEMTHNPCDINILLDIIMICCLPIVWNNCEGSRKKMKEERRQVTLLI